jgi:predicted RNase H-like HicB family nuclease
MPATDEIVIEESSPSREVRHCDKCGLPMITAHALQCKDCGAVTYLRCFVRRVSDCYVAECIDLDISAEGETLESAIAGLQDAMDGYLGVALDTNTSGPVVRPSPWTHRARYYVEYAKDALSARLFRPRARTEKFYAVSVGTASHCHVG